jgi:hypothetical protein
MICFFKDESVLVQLECNKEVHQSNCQNGLTAVIEVQRNKYLERDWTARAEFVCSWWIASEPLLTPARPWSGESMIRKDSRPFESGGRTR